jgi:cytochrome b subunit of formate dehydrogenase
MSKSQARFFLRFPITRRIEHWLLVLSFSTLALTGLTQKFAAVKLSQWMIALLGGVETVRIIHRVAAVTLALEAVYHLWNLAYKLLVLRVQPTMLPGFADARAIWQTLLYNLRLRKRPAQEGRYTYAEKFEYWALIWGIIIMGLTGFLLWNPIAATSILPGEIIPAAKVAHGMEAVLAVLALLLWHVYTVHIRSFNKSIFNGKLTEQEMLEEHPLELADIKAGVAQRPTDAQTLRRRQRIFIPISSIVALAAVAGVFYFATFEKTAIRTVPPAEDVTIYAPFTPTPPPPSFTQSTPPPGSPSSWDGGIGGLFAQRCMPCHSTASDSGGLDLSSYQGALQGGISGPAIVPGDPAASILIVRQSTGDHPGQLSPEELAIVRSWIAAGAPQE